MKAKYALIALLAITFWNCDDNTAGLGLGMFPGSDQNINGKLTTFDVTTQSIPVGEVYAKTNIGYVGKFTDEIFGTYQAGFLVQLNCPEGMTFPEAFKGDYNSGTGKMIADFNNVEESVHKNYTTIKDGETSIGNCQINIYLWYDSYFGDSLTACRLSMYELDKKKEGTNEYWYKDPNAYYTYINPDLYYDKETSLLGRKSYTAVDLSVSDSIRNLSTYTPYVKITLDKARTEELGKELLKEGRTKDLYKKFQDIFPGLYVESDYGDGTILYVNAVQMDVAFLEHARDSITGAKLRTSLGKDSVVYAGRSFTSTREVIQANKLENGTKIEECIDRKDCTYLKSPAGIFTEVTLPIEEISNTLGSDTLNAVKLSIPIYNEATSDKKFGMSVPRSVLLIRKKYKDDFFKNNELSDGIKSSLFDYSSSTGNLTAYTFNNITQMVNNCLADKDKGEDWNKFVLIPVLVTKDSSANSNYGTSSNVISIQHDLKPGYARLKGGANATDPTLSEDEQDKYKLKLEVISTNFNK